MQVPFIYYQSTKNAGRRQSSTHDQHVASMDTKGSLYTGGSLPLRSSSNSKSIIWFSSSPGLSDMLPDVFSTCSVSFFMIFAPAGGPIAFSHESAGTSCHLVTPLLFFHVAGRDLAFCSTLFLAMMLLPVCRD